MGMISVGFKPAEAETQASTPDDAVLGQHRASLRDIQGEPDQQPWKKMLIFVYITYHKYFRMYL